MITRLVPSKMPASLVLLSSPTLDTTTWEIERTCRGQLNVWSEFVELLNVMRTNSCAKEDWRMRWHFSVKFTLLLRAWMHAIGLNEFRQNRRDYFVPLFIGTIDELRANIWMSESFWISKNMPNTFVTGSWCLMIFVCKFLCIGKFNILTR